MFYNYIIFLQSQIDTESNWSSKFGIGQFFLFIVVFAIILFFAYFFTKWISSVKTGGKNNGFFKVIVGMPLGGSNSLQLIKAGERYFLIGISKENVTYIAEIDKNDVPEYSDKKIDFPFEKYFHEYFDKLKNKEKSSDDENKI